MKTLKLSGNMIAVPFDRATGECEVEPIEPTTPGTFAVRLEFASADDLQRWTRYAADVAMTDGQPGAIKASLAAGALKRAKIKPMPEASIADFNAQADQADRESFQELITMLEQALPGFKGCPAPDDWAKAALRELIRQHAAMRDTARAIVVNAENNPILESILNDKCRVSWPMLKECIQLFGGVK